jgi:Flp pilus assembly pilin Flp
VASVDPPLAFHVFFLKSDNLIAAPKLGGSSVADGRAFRMLAADERGGSLAEYAIVLATIAAILAVAVKQHAAIADMLHTIIANHW